ncbi:MAG TPA: aspartyl protease family protein [Allosphingosinicella sp.]|nr:aspartyl protease family protein [Allosphingosinicella sp.]
MTTHVACAALAAFAAAAIGMSAPAANSASTNNNVSTSDVSTLAEPMLPGAAPPAADEPFDMLKLGVDGNDRMTVPVSVIDQGPYPFLIDTGAERTVISQELAQRLALAAGGAIRIHSMTEASDVATAIIPKLQISKNAVHNIRAPALPLANIGAAGMLGVDSLKSQRVIFDFAKKRMSIAAAGKRVEDWGPDTIVVTGKSLYGRLILVDSRLEGEKVIVVIDTGSEVTVGNNALRRKLLEKRKLRATIPVELTSVTGGRQIIDYTSVRRITLGGVNLLNMPIGFAEVHPFAQLGLSDRPAILLGMDALRLFQRVSVDFARKEVRFMMPETAPIRFSV